MASPARGLRPVRTGGPRRSAREHPARARLVAFLLAWALLPVAPAAAQEDLWQQFPLDPSPTPETRDTTPTPTPTQAGESRRVAATPDGGDGGSGTAWIVAAVLGVAGIGVTIAGLSIARREPQAADPLPAAPAWEGATPSAAGPPRRKHAPPSVPREPPVPPPAPIGVAPSADWEECQVALSAGEGDEQHFHAARAEPGEPVARSPVFRARRASAVMESADAREALQILVTNLLEGGWQLVGRDGDPWALRFRRRVRAPVAPLRHPAGR